MSFSSYNIPLSRSGRNHQSVAFQTPTGDRDTCIYLKNSFFPQTIRDRNSLPELVISSAEILLPEKLQTEMFNAYHDDLGLQGRTRTLCLMKRRWFWPGIDSFVSRGRCICRKIVASRPLDLVNIVYTAPMEIVCIDYLRMVCSKGGFENMLVRTVY